MTATLRIGKTTLACALILCVASVASAQTTWYVDDDAANDPGPGDVTISDPSEDGSLAHPFDAIQEAINAAVAGDEVLVADGTYTGTGNKGISFGGKAIVVHSENGASYCTIDCENDLRALYCHENETNATVIDGFTIVNGDRSASSGDGGAVACYSGSSPTIQNCVITNCYVGRFGGGVYVQVGAPVFINCLIVDNEADDDGGGVYCTGSAATFVNCTITGNTAADSGGGAHVQTASDIVVENTIIADNTATNGSDVSLLGTSNPSTLTISYSCVLGGESAVRTLEGCTLNWGDGMTGGDPLILNAAGGDYHLLPGSPCIDGGTNAPASGLLAYDIEGNVRTIDGDGDTEPWTGVAATVDMGPYESFALDVPLIQVSPPGLSFTAVFGEANPAPQTLSIRNSGIDTLNWQIIEDCSWLSVDPNSGSSTGEADDVTVSVDVTGLAVGDYLCELEITDPAAGNNPQIVPVTLRVGTPLICVSAESLTFFAEYGGATPDAQVVSIENCGIGALNWTLVEDIAWLTVDPNTGTSTGEADDVAFTVDVTGLSVGEYSDQCDVVCADAPNSPVAIDITLIVYEVSDAVLFVDDDAPLGGSGASWPTAYRYLQDALAVAAGNPVIQEIRIAGGTYLPDADEAGNVTVGDVNSSFQMLNNVTIAGGYRGLAAGGSPDDRDVTAFETVLSGDLGVVDTYDDNAYQVVIGSGVDQTAILDGLTVAYGFAGSDDWWNPSITHRGAGIYIDSGSPLLRDCTIRENRCVQVSSYIGIVTYPDGRGGGVFCTNGAPQFENCTIRDNQSMHGRYGYPEQMGVVNGQTDGGDGGGLCFIDSTPTLTDCTIIDNATGIGGYAERSGGCGGGVFFSNSSALLERCVISGNTTGRGSFGDAYEMSYDGWSGGDGAGICATDASSLILSRCELTGNSTGDGGEGGLGGWGTVGGDGGRGGALFVDGGSFVECDGCRITQNGTGSGGEGGIGDWSAGPGGAGGLGGGVYVAGSTTQVSLTNCLMADNATGDGGDGADSVVGGYADGGDAGEAAGLFADMATVLIVNCTITGNSTGTPGSGDASGASATCGGVFDSAAALTFVSDVLWDNEAEAGSLEQNQLNSVTATVSYSCVEGWTGTLDGVGNTGNTPMFVDAVNGDYRLSSGSPCIDAGDNTAVPLDTHDLDGDGNTTERLPFDCDGMLRFADRPGTADTGVADAPDYPYVVDMGAFEYQCTGDLDGDGAINLADLQLLLSGYGDTDATYAGGDLDGSGTVDPADLQLLLSAYGQTCP